MIRYKVNILKKLNEKGFTTYKLVKSGLIGNATIQKYRNNVVAYGKNLDLLCRLLDCQPGDILEYVPADMG